MEPDDARAARLSLRPMDAWTPPPSVAADARGRRLGVILVFVALAFAAFVRHALQSVPFERDEGIYAYFGRLILEGATPYVSFYEIKPPGLYYAYAAIVALFGDGIEELHAGFAVVNFATIVAVFAVGWRLLGPVLGGLAAWVFAILSVMPGLSGFAAQSEHWIALLATLSLGAALQALVRGSTAWLALAGVLAGASMTIKQSGVLFVVAVGVFAVLAHVGQRRRPRSQLARDLVVIAGGTCAVYGGAALAMAAMGAFEEFWFWTVEFPQTYVTQIGASGGVERFFRYAAKVTDNAEGLWGLAAIGAIGVLAGGGGPLARGVLLAFSVLSFLAIVPGQRFYGHYWIQAIPAVALLVGAGVLAIERAGRLVSVGAWPARVAWGVAALAIAQPLVAERGYFFSPDPDGVSRRVYFGNPFPEARVVGDFLAEQMAPEEELFVIGSEPQLYLYTDKRLPSRHAYFEYVIIRHPRHVEWQREFMLDIEKTDPEWIVFFDHATSLGGDVDPDSRDRFLIWLRRFLDRKGYVPVGVADMVDLGDTRYTFRMDGLGSELGRTTAKVVVYRHPDRPPTR